jgi:CRP-like cAMP-binding protein
LTGAIILPSQIPESCAQAGCRFNNETDLKMVEQFNKMFPLPKDKCDGHMSYWHRVEVWAGTVLIKEGEIAKKVFLIEKGCIRSWINNNGKEITFQFFFENEAVSSSESFRKNIPSLFTLETIEPCVLYWIHKKNWEKVMNDISQIPEMNNKGINLLLERYYQYIKQLISFLNESPEHRYLHLLKEKPHILQRVPLQYIATYLGVTPVSLSRIRKRVSTKENHMRNL